MTDQMEAFSSFASQIGSMSAFFGGVAATLLALLTFKLRKDALIEVTIGSFVIATVSFIVCALAATVTSIGVTPGADPTIASRAYLETSLLLMNLAFLLGAVSLITGVILLGWLRSRRTGLVTTAIGLVGLCAVLWLSIRVS